MAPLAPFPGRLARLQLADVRRGKGRLGPVARPYSPIWDLPATGPGRPRRAEAQNAVLWGALVAAGIGHSYGNYGHIGRSYGNYGHPGRIYGNYGHTGHIYGNLVTPPHLRSFDKGK
jgi:hypothetical protein